MDDANAVFPCPLRGLEFGCEAQPSCDEVATLKQMVIAVCDTVETPVYESFPWFKNPTQGPGPQLHLLGSFLDLASWRVRPNKTKRDPAWWLPPTWKKPSSTPLSGSRNDRHRQHRRCMENCIRDGPRRRQSASRAYRWRRLHECSDTGRRRRAQRFRRSQVPPSPAQQTRLEGWVSGNSAASPAANRLCYRCSGQRTCAAISSSSLPPSPF